MEIVLCHPYGEQNFEVVPRFLKTLCTPDVVVVVVIKMVVRE
jgi:hypothetical protein